MSHARSGASPTPKKHRSGIIIRAQAALSSFSKPVEEWGVSNVPVLSTSVTPRRERTSETRSRQNSNSSMSTISSPCKLRHDEMIESPSRVPHIRPLSIATVSTFGGWILEQVSADDEAEDTCIAQNAEIGTQSISRRSVLTSKDYTQHVTPVRHRYAFPASPSVRLAGSARRGCNTGIHPLRMHPPSPSPSLSSQTTTARCQTTPALSRSPSSIPLPSTPSLDGRASEASRETNSTRRSRRTLHELNIDAANAKAQTHTDEYEHKDQGQTEVTPTHVVPADKHSSFPRDVGYVEAMRLWYEEKENEALEIRTHELKTARRARTASCALASVKANQHL